MENSLDWDEEDFADMKSRAESMGTTSANAHISGRQLGRLVREIEHLRVLLADITESRNSWKNLAELSDAQKPVNRESK